MVPNADLLSSSNISKMVWYTLLLWTFYKEDSISFLMICRLINFALVMFKLLESQKLSFSIFPVLKGLIKRLSVSITAVLISYNYVRISFDQVLRMKGLKKSRLGDIWVFSILKCCTVQKLKFFIDNCFIFCALLENGRNAKCSQPLLCPEIFCNILFLKIM